MRFKTYLKELPLNLGNKVSLHKLHRRVYLPLNSREESPKCPLFLFLSSLVLQTVNKNLIERAKIKKYKDISFGFQNLILKLLSTRVRSDKYVSLFIIFGCSSVCPAGLL